MDNLERVKAGDLDKVRKKDYTKYTAKVKIYLNY